MREFRFTHHYDQNRGYSIKNRIFVTDIGIKVEIGVSEREVLFSNIQHFYSNTIISTRANGGRNYLIISYSVGSRTKKIEINSDLDSSIFDHLVDELKTLLPDKSLHNLSEEEALKLLKSTNWKKNSVGTAILSISFILLFIGSCNYAHVRHALDFGYLKTNVKDLGNPDTGNLSLEGKLVREEFISIINPGSYTNDFLRYAPLVDTSWKAGDSVRIIAMFRTKAINDSIPDERFYTGVVRDIGLEGLPNDIKRRMTEMNNMKLADSPILFEITWQKRNDTFVWNVFLVYLVVGTGVYFVDKIRLKRRIKYRKLEEQHKFK